MIREILSQLRLLLQGKPKSEIDDEVQFHIERATDANIDAGMTPA